MATRLGGGAPGHAPAPCRSTRRCGRCIASSALRVRAARAAHRRRRDVGGAGRRQPRAPPRPLRRREGIDVQILSARDEARLGVDAALESLPFTNGIVADLGGASLQLSRVRDRRRRLHREPAARRRAHHAPLPAPRSADAARAAGAAQRDPQQLVDAVPPSAGAARSWWGSAAPSARWPASTSGAQRGDRKHATGCACSNPTSPPIRERLEGLSRRKRRKIRGLKAERADIILAGAIVIEEVMVFGGYLTLVGLHARRPRRRPAARDRSAGEADVNADAFVNRELSWLEFNRRVLEEAQDPSVPLLERVKFLAIFSSNLDEFFMVRVAALKRRVRAGDRRRGPTGSRPRRRCARSRRESTSWSTRSTAASSTRSSRCSPPKGSSCCVPRRSATRKQRFLEEYFRRTLLPVLTPLAVDPGHPFPYLGNRSLCLVVAIRPSRPSALPRELALRDPHPEPGPAALRRAARIPRAARLHAARGRDSPAPADPLQRLRDPLEPRHPRHARRRSPRRAAGPTICSPASRRACASGAWARRCGCSTTRICRPTSWPRCVDELELAPEDLYEGEGFTAFSRSVPALRRARPAPAQGPAAAAASGPGVRERVRHLDRHPRRRRPRAPSRTTPSTPSPASCARPPSIPRCSPSR